MLGGGGGGGGRNWNGQGNVEGEWVGWDHEWVGGLRMIWVWKWGLSICLTSIQVKTTAI